MNLTLTRTDFLSTGIFGELNPDDDSFTLQTLEHAYSIAPIGGSVSTSWAAKVAPGVYTCVRHAPNRLPYDTFMLENVPDFEGQPVTGILIHILNFDAQSEGCIGVGLGRIGNVEITQSKAAFDLLMLKQTGIDQFTLTVS